MENNTSISTRIKQLIDYKQITINKFAEKVGASYVILNNNTILLFLQFYLGKSKNCDNH